MKNSTSVLSFCIGPKSVSSNDDTKALFLCELHFSQIFTSRPLNHQRTNKQLINLLSNDVKNLTSILSCCIGPKCVSCNDDTKALFSCESHFSIIIKRRPLNLQLTNKQPINLLYNDVKNLTSTLSFCIGPKCVTCNDDTKTLFFSELHFSLIIKSRPLNLQLTNKQPINLLYNAAKNLTSTLSFCIFASVRFLTIWKLYFCENYNFHLFFQVDL